MGLQRVRHNWATKTSVSIVTAQVLLSQTCVWPSIAYCWVMSCVLLFSFLYVQIMPPQFDGNLPIRLFFQNVIILHLLCKGTTIDAGRIQRSKIYGLAFRLFRNLRSSGRAKLYTYFLPHKYHKTVTYVHSRTSIESDIDSAYVSLCFSTGLAHCFINNRL